MRILAIESTCDETGAAVVEDGRAVLSNVVASQIDLHAKYRGVVPEIASRAHIENILPVLREACETAGCRLGDVNAIAVAHRPGLIGSLLVGVTAAKSLAWALGKPLIGIDHVHAHLYSVMLEERQKAEGRGQKGIADRSSDTPGERQAFDSTTPSVASSVRRFVASAPSFPAVGLVCSGGHTALYELKSWLDVRMIGSTIDDAVGEAYDKVSALLALGYPGGPIIDRLAQSGDPKAIDFPRSLMARESLDFSFSGLKTAVLYKVYGVPGRGAKPSTLAGPPKMSEQELADIAASFQAACVEVIVRKIERAARYIGAKSVIIGGGVSANRGLRAGMKNFRLPVFFPPMEFCTDNAAMTGGLAWEHLRTSGPTGLDLDAIPFSQFNDRA